MKPDRTETLLDRPASNGSRFLLIKEHWPEPALPSLRVGRVYATYPVSVGIPVSERHAFLAEVRAWVDDCDAQEATRKVESRGRLPGYDVEDTARPGASSADGGPSSGGGQ